MAGSAFETVAAAQLLAQRRLPSAVYLALLAGSERGQTYRDNLDAFTELGFAPLVAGQPARRSQVTTVLGQEVALPVVISPTGVHAVHPEGEVAVARAAAARGTAIGLSSFGSKSVEEVMAANPQTFFQLYWVGTRDAILERVERARSAGAKALIVTTDWSFSKGRDWGTPPVPAGLDLAALTRFAPQLLRRPRYVGRWLRAGTIPQLTAPNLARHASEPAPTFLDAYTEFMQTPPPGWDDIAWLAGQWGGPFLLKGVCRVDDARRAVDAGVSAISVSNHGGNNLDGTPAAIRTLRPIADAVGHQVEVLLDGGVRRGSDVVKALALGARAVLIGRAPLWGLAVNGQAGVEQVLDILRGGVDSALMGIGAASVHDLTPEHLVIPPGFHRALGDSR